jgi:hypothetical protein
MREKCNSAIDASVPSNIARVNESCGLLNQQQASRRTLFTRPLQVAGVLGALELLDASEATAENVGNSQSRSPKIDPSLLKSLQFNRENAEDPGVAFLPDLTEVLVGFGKNLLYQTRSTATRMQLRRYLLMDGRYCVALSASMHHLSYQPGWLVGTTGTVTQKSTDQFGRVMTSTLVLEAINDVPDDFLVTGTPLVISSRGRITK